MNPAGDQETHYSRAVPAALGKRYTFMNVPTLYGTAEDTINTVAEALIASKPEAGDPFYQGSEIYAYMCFKARSRQKEKTLSAWYEEWGRCFNHGAAQRTVF
ncbi:Lanosterol synthase [Elsinoe australis]|uniref:Lanosterol synthase n=1 Tax=Elsinoe australis TaxID=40998 RepID=A0A2P7YN99_9PEZI|nr:Lanosterol synthase [Elsinoe australis]